MHLIILYLATAYGKGSYFSTTSEYSLNYSKDSGERSMILAKVLTGKYMVGTPSMDARNLTGYHSTVNNQLSPTIFVVYHDAAAYPSYVVKFKNK